MPGFSAFQKFSIKRIIGQSERYVHPGAEAWFNGVGVEIVAINETIQLLCFPGVHLAHGLNTALLFQPLEHQPGQVPGIGRRGVVHGAVIGDDLIVHHGRRLFPGLTQEILTDNYHHQARGADVLLGAGIDQTEFADIQRPG